MYTRLMLEITTEIDVLNRIFSPVDELAESCEIIFDPGKLKIPAADEMGIAITDIVVDSGSFQKYNSDGKRIGIRLEKLTKILNRSEGNTRVRLSLEENDLLKVSLNNKEHFIGLVSLDSVPKQPGMPPYEFSVRFSIEKGVLKDTVETAGVFGDKVIFDADEVNSIIWVNARGDIDRTKMTLDRDMVDIQEIDDVKNSFDQSYLSDLINTCPNEAQIEMRLADGHPLNFEYSIFGGDGYVETYLAPWKEGTELP